MYLFTPSELRPARPIFPHLTDNPEPTLRVVFFVNRPKHLYGIRHRLVLLSIPSYYTASGQIIPIEFNHLSEKAIAHLIRDSYAMLCRPALQLMFSQRADGQHQSHQHSQRLDAPTFFRSTSEIAKFEPSRNWDLCSATLSHLYCARRASGERLSSLVAKKFIYTLEHYRIESNKNRQLQKQVMLFLHICRQLLRGGLGHSTIQKLLNQPTHIVIFMRYIVPGGAGLARTLQTP